MPPKKRTRGEPPQTAAVGSGPSSKAVKPAAAEVRVPEVVAEQVVTLLTERLGREVWRRTSLEPGSAHASIVTQLCASVGGASRLGHRTCHCLWGAPGNGKRRILQAVRDSFTADPGLRREFAVVSFEAGALESDDEALAVLFEALRTHFHFLQSSQRGRQSGHTSSNFNPAAVLKALSKLFEVVIPEVLADALRHSDAGLTAEGAPAMPQQTWTLATTLTSRWFSSLEAMALDTLQRALIDVNQAGLSLIAFVSDISRFAARCDRVAYMLSGLMHECEQRGGGVSLLCTSLSSDFSLEKRLSSRLCCEVWFCPPIGITLATMWKAVTAPLTDAEGESVAALPHTRKPVAAALSSLCALLDEPADSAWAGCVRAIDARCAVFGRSAAFCRDLLTVYLTTVEPARLGVDGDGLLHAERELLLSSDELVGFGQLQRDAPRGRLVRRHVLLPRESVLLLAATFVLSRSDPVGLSASVALIGAQFPAERAASRTQPYGDGLDILLERGWCLLTRQESIILARPAAVVKRLLRKVVSTPELALSFGVSAERGQLKSWLGL